MSQHHVHLSPNVMTAIKVGTKHGQPVVLVVDAMAMYDNGYVFYCSDSGVWLVDSVPLEYLKISEP